MRDKDLYAQILGIKSPWQVSGVELALSEGEVTVHVEQEEGVQHCCPTCGEVSPGYDSRKRKWRHLDTCQYKTILVADVPRVKCKEHGVVTVSVPWAEPGSGFTAMFEALVIDWLKEASTAAVSRLMGLSWNAIDGIMQRAVKRGLSRREELSMTQIGVDETAFKKRHDYVTIVSDQEAGTVLFVGEDRKKATLKAWYESLTEAQREAIESISMDMWPAFINATLESLPKVEDKIAFDKFHVAKYLGEAVDKVRRQEHKTLMAEGYEDKRVFGLVIDFGTSQSPKSTRPLTTYWCPSRPGHQALRNNFASSLLLRTWLPYDWTPRSEGLLCFPSGARHAGKTVRPRGYWGLPAFASLSMAGSV